MQRRGTRLAAHCFAAIAASTAVFNADSSALLRDASAMMRSASPIALATARCFFSSGTLVATPVLPNPPAPLNRWGRSDDWGGGETHCEGRGTEKERCTPVSLDDAPDCVLQRRHLGGIDKGNLLEHKLRDAIAHRDDEILCSMVE